MTVQPQQSSQPSRYSDPPVDPEKLRMLQMAVEKQKRDDDEVYTSVLFLTLDSSELEQQKLKEREQR